MSVLKIAAIVLAIFGAAYLVRIVEHPPPESLEDFSAFYCGARLAATHENPYDDAALGRCERGVAPWHRGGVMPAPYPPYALLLLFPLSLLPFGIAGAIWIAGIVGAIAVSCVVIARLARAPLVVAVAAFAATIWFPSMIAASMAAYPILLVLLAAYALRRERWSWAAVFLGLGMTKPNLALPACLAAFAILPQMRLRLAAVGAALFVAQTLVAGPKLFLSYVEYVHAYAARDVANAWQYSLVYALHMLGVADRIAVGWGWAQYAIAVVAGIAIGAVFARRCADAAWVVLTPLAFAVVGGIYARQQELAAAIPFGVMLAYQAPSALARLALVLLATPWSAVYGDGAYPPFVMLSTGTLVHQLWRPPRIVTLLAAFGSVVVLLSFTNGSTPSNEDWFPRHLPEWLGQAMLLGGCAFALWEGSRRSVPQPSH
ncbi:MAG TPA: glycosyltransferase family 87 protein [Candidatus Tyrphobacter sp.]